MRSMLAPGTPLPHDACMKIVAALASLTIATVATAAAAHADAMSDQKKAYDALGIHIPHPPALCRLMSKAEVARFVGGPVKDGVSAGPVAGCAWYLADGSSDGLLVMRGPRGDMYPPTREPSYKKVGGVGERAYTVHTATGYEADAMTAKGITTVIMRAKGASTDKALAALRVVMNR